jgi:hypothetical protein
MAEQVFPTEERVMLTTRIPTVADKAKTIVFILGTVFVITASAFALLTRLGGFGILLWFGVCVGSVYLLVRWHARTTAYRCSICDYEFEISTPEDFLSAHVFPSWKFLKCPHCGKRNWTTALIKTDP